MNNTYKVLILLDAKTLEVIHLEAHVHVNHALAEKAWNIKRVALHCPVLLSPIAGPTFGNIRFGEWGIRSVAHQ